MRQLFIILGLLIFCGNQLMAQFNTGGRFGNAGGGGGGGKMQVDTTKHEHEVDTLTLTYQYLGDPILHKLDSSINKFDLNYLKIPANYVFLGNNGNAARNIIFTPRMRAGFDAGFHSYDIYAFTHETARFYNTTKPYSELSYMIGSKQEQVIGVSHTQNRGKNFNFSFDYRKVNSPGFYRNQNTNHDTYRVTANYHSPNKRYHLYLSYYLNKLNGGENGGIRSDSFLSNPRFNERRTIDVNLGNNDAALAGFFGSTIPVKSAYQESGILLQQQYDWGKGDTVHVNDTTQYYKFDPVFRVQYTFMYNQNDYQFIDNNPDTAFYTKNYNFAYIPDSSIFAKHKWRNVVNDISLIQFPVRGNLAHFINVGARFENLSGTFLDASINFSNLALHGEYRNKTRNQKWDFSAKGEFYALGQNIGDYSATGVLSRYLNETLGNISFLFSNVNSEPSYVYKYFNSNRDTWYKDNLGKENTTQLQFAADNKKLKYNLAVNYFIFSNYTYFKDYYHSEQYNSVFNLLQVVFSKQFTVKKFNWYADLAFQQIHGTAPLNVPTIWTRHRFAYENKLFNNLNLMTGIEAKYTTSYYADNYSPLTGQFFYQQQNRINDAYPYLAAFLNFRIKSFTAYIRAEELNTFFGKENFAANLYPYNNFMFRVAIRWWFIN
jgi:hypothetical protein